MYRIEFNDAGILRDCTTDNALTVGELFHQLSKLYKEVYAYRLDLSGAEVLLASTI